VVVGVAVCVVCCLFPVLPLFSSSFSHMAQSSVQ
jgi:hypothetical protein